MEVATREIQFKRAITGYAMGEYDEWSGFDYIQDKYNLSELYMDLLAYFTDTDGINQIGIRINGPDIYLYRYVGEYEELIDCIKDLEDTTDDRAQEFIDTLIEDVYNSYTLEFEDNNMLEREIAIFYEMVLILNDNDICKSVIGGFLEEWRKEKEENANILRKCANDYYGIAVLTISLLSLTDIQDRVELDTNLRNRVNNIIANPEGYEELMHAINILSPIRQIEETGYTEFAEIIFRTYLGLALVLDDVLK